MVMVRVVLWLLVIVSSAGSELRASEPRAKPCDDRQQVATADAGTDAGAAAESDGVSDAQADTASDAQVDAQVDTETDTRGERRWTMAELEPSLAEFQQGRSFVNGKRMYEVANCVACHRMDGNGQEIGPDLTKLEPKKLTPREILRHVVMPSAEIHPDYQTYVFELNSGQTVTGLIVAAGVGSLRVLENPLVSTQPLPIRLDQIANRTASQTSMMPEGLLDKLTRQEILDLIAYVRARGNDQDPIYRTGAR